MNEASCTVPGEWSHVLLDFCGKHNITADVEVIPIQKINEAYEWQSKADVMYHLSIDMASQITITLHGGFTSCFFCYIQGYVNSIAAINNLVLEPCFNMMILKSLSSLIRDQFMLK